MSEDGLKEIRLLAEEITCGGCAMDMENILRETDGIRHAEVRFPDGAILIRYDPQGIARDEVVSAVRRLGFPVKFVSES